MKLGKFEISDGFSYGLVLIAILFIILHFTLAEEKLKEETKQLELKKEILLLEKGDLENGKVRDN